MADRSAPHGQPCFDGKVYLKVFYDGVRYKGWAKQKGEPTIQAAFEDALRKTGAEIVGIAAFSRTDAGVSALSQVVRVRGQGIRPTALNRTLPEDIAITHYSTSLGGVKSKTYVYVRGEKWRHPQLVAEAAERLQKTGLLGKLYKSGGAPPTSECEIELLSTHAQEYIFFKAKGFGYQQVRMAVGYLEAVDSAGSFPKSLSKIRPAEACGLILLEVEVAGEWTRLEEGILKAKRYLASKLESLERTLSLYRFMSHPFA